MIKKVLSAEYYKRKVSRIIHITNACLSAAVIALMPLLMKLYNLSAVFRSAGDTNFPMVISISSMLLVRVVCAYFFSVNLRMGMLGTWAAMFLDWFVKGIIYEIRYHKGTWKNYKLV